MLQVIVRVKRDHVIRDLATGRRGRGWSRGDSARIGNRQSWQKYQEDGDKLCVDAGTLVSVFENEVQVRNIRHLCNCSKINHVTEAGESTRYQNNQRSRVSSVGFRMMAAPSKRNAGRGELECLAGCMPRRI